MNGMEAVAMKVRISILDEAVEKAIAGGWDPLSFGGIERWESLSAEQKYQHISNMVVMGSRVESESYPGTIFNHNFAKALWGEDTNYLYSDDHQSRIVRPDWQYHLQRMVIAPDPIAYLGDNI